MLEDSVNDILHQLIQPVLVLFGEKDKLIPNKMLHRSLTYQDLMTVAEKKILISDVQSVNNAGHFIQIDDYFQTNRLIEKFLK